MNLLRNFLIFYAACFCFKSYFHKLICKPRGLSNIQQTGLAIDFVIKLR